MKITTIKLTEDTKNRLSKLNIAEKGKSFDILINELINSYEKNTNKYKKDYKNWELQMKNWKDNIKNHNNTLDTYNKEKQTWDNLLKWAKSKGFKG